MNVGEALNLLEGLPNLFFECYGHLWLNLETWEIHSDYERSGNNPSLSYVDAPIKEALAQRNANAVKELYQEQHYRNLFDVEGIKEAFAALPSDIEFYNIETLYVEYGTDILAVRTDSFDKDYCVDLATLSLATKQKLSEMVSHIDMLKKEIDTIKENIGLVLGLEPV